MKRTFVVGGSSAAVLGVVLACGACSGSGSPGTSVPGLDVKDTIAYQKAEPGGVTELDIRIANYAGACSLEQANGSQMANGESVKIELRSVGAIVVGEYPFADQDPSSGKWLHKLETVFTDGACNESSIKATAGSVSIDTASASGVTGSFSVIFSGGQTTKGSFSAPLCDVSHASSGTYACHTQNGSSVADAGGSSISVTGTYTTQETSSNGNTYTRDMSIIQNGTTLSAEYIPTADPYGTISGTMNGMTLTGTWLQHGVSGPIHFVFSADGSSFTGTWDYAGGPGRYAWTGTRTSTTPTKLLPNGTGSTGGCQANSDCGSCQWCSVSTGVCNERLVCN